MDVYLSDQSPHFQTHLSRLGKNAVMEYDVSQLRHTITSVVVPSPVLFSELDFGFFLNYQLFPSAIMSAYPQWAAEGRSMAPGDTIVQQVQIPPIGLAPKIIMGVRIKETINQPGKIGYSYETLAGHVERGISAFTIEDVAGEIKFSIETFSEPALLAGRLLAPVFTIPYQRYCTQQALNNVEAHIRRQF